MMSIMKVYFVTYACIWASVCISCHLMSSGNIAPWMEGCLVVPGMSLLIACIGTLLDKNSNMTLREVNLP